MLPQTVVVELSIRPRLHRPTSTTRARYRFPTATAAHRALRAKGWTHLCSAGLWTDHGEHRNAVVEFPDTINLRDHDGRLLPTA